MKGGKRMGLYGGRRGRMLLSCALGLAIVACAGSSEEAPAQTREQAKTPQSQVVLFGATSADAGERLYGSKCAFCHVGRNTGTIMLGRRLGKEMAELHKRTDLDADYVKAVVRTGIVNMPPISRVDVTDDELEKIADYLARTSGK